VIREQREKGSRALTVGSLFSGIGGLDLGLERAGMEVRWQCELDGYCSRVLAKHWPGVPNLGDVTKVDWSHVERVDLICGGYPCQPFSLAGARRGHDDPRHLWPHFADALRVLRPRFALLENVPGHFSLGFGDVLGDLAELGYDCEWECIPAAAVGAPHLRYRIFVVAYEPSGAVDALARSGELVLADTSSHARRVGNGDGAAHVPHPRGQQLRKQPVALGGGGSATVARHDGAHRDVADADCTRRPILQGRSKIAELARLRASGNAGWWTVEPDVGRVAHGVPSRVDRLRALGNAVVPQVAEFVGRAILASLEDSVKLPDTAGGRER